MINISGIERFATHDGPGIRSVVFMQGCLLKCPWCANPEAQKIGTALMHNSNKCRSCQICAGVCESQAISFNNHQFSYNANKCTYCLNCATHCLNSAISFSGESKSVDEIISILLKDQEYYDESNGGITISGGEAFFQFDGFIELLKSCKKVGLNVCVETCGQYALQHLKMAMPYIDQFYFDLKHIDAQIYRDIVKGDLKQVLTNLEYLAANVPNKTVIRVPVIPDFNNCEKTLLAILDYAKSIKIKAVHFLPYHTLASDKYAYLNRQYNWNRKKVTEKSLLKYVKIAHSKDILLKING